MQHLKTKSPAILAQIIIVTNTYCYGLLMNDQGALHNDRKKTFVYI